MKKNIKKVLCFGLMALTLTAIGIGVNAASNSFEAPKQIRSLYNDRNNSKTLAQIESDKITQNDLKIARMTRQDSISDKQLLDILVNDELLYTEAKAENLEASDKDVASYISDVRNCIKNNVSQEDKSKFQDVIKGYGVSEEEYWTKIAPTAYKKLLTVGNFKEKLTKNISTENIKQDEKAQLVNEKINSEIQNLKEKYKNSLQIFQ